MPRKPKGSEDTAPRDTAPVKMDKELHRKAKMLAVSERKELYEILDDILRPAIESRYIRLFKEKP